MSASIADNKLSFYNTHLLPVRVIIVLLLVISLDLKNECVKTCNQKSCHAESRDQNFQYIYLFIQSYLNTTHQQWIRRKKI